MTTLYFGVVLVWYYMHKYWQLLEAVTHSLS